MIGVNGAEEIDVNGQVIPFISGWEVLSEHDAGVPPTA